MLENRVTVVESMICSLFIQLDDGFFGWEEEAPDAQGLVAAVAAEDASRRLRARQHLVDEEPGLFQP